MANFQKKRTVNTIASGHISLVKKVQTYHGQSRVQMSGKLTLSNGNVLFVNLPVDSNGKILSYKGKNENADKVYCRVYATEVSGSKTNF